MSMEERMKAAVIYCHIPCEVEDCRKPHNECGHEQEFDPEGCSACFYEDAWHDCEAENKRKLEAFDEMLAALVNAVSQVRTLSCNHPDDEINNAVVAQCDKAIAKAKGV